MGALFAAHWFDLVQTIGIVAGLAFSGYAIYRDERSRQISNVIAINERYHDVWQEFFRNPGMARVLEREVDLAKEPIKGEEGLFVKMLILHLDTVRRATKVGLFIKIETLKSDIREFISLPIPKAVWTRMRPFQDREFVDFVESALK